MHLSVTQVFNMMASCTSYVVCGFLCLLYAVHSATISGTITKNIYKLPTEVEFTEYINGDNFTKVLSLTLTKLVDVDTLSNLTLVNFNSLNSLSLRGISLVQVPIFENITSDYIDMSTNKLKTLPTDAFEGAQVRVIHLQKNQIQSMSDSSINIYVRELFLRCNKLSNFSHTWFKDPSRIRTLDLAGNRIEYLQHQAFKQMTQLSVLKLGYNHLRRIGNEAFSSGTTYVQLQFNDLEELTPDMFARRDIPIEFLYLHHNLLSFLPDALLQKFKIARISLDGNPWQCQCLRNIEAWIREQNVTRRYLHVRRNEPMCVLPVNFPTVCVPAADKELQQTFAKGQSPLPGYLAEGCGQFSELGLDLIFG